MKKELRELPLSSIHVDEALMPRLITKVSEDTVKLYAELLESGTKFPPIKVWEDAPNHYILLDGQHRFRAYQRIGRRTIHAEVLTGITREEAKLIAIRENAQRGLPLTREELRLLARNLAQEGLPKKLIAETLGVSESTLRRWLKDLIQKEKEQKESRNEEILALYELGLTPDEIAEQTGVSRATIFRVLKKVKEEETGTPPSSPSKEETMRPSHKDSSSALDVSTETPPPKQESHPSKKESADSESLISEVQETVKTLKKLLKTAKDADVYEIVVGYVREELKPFLAEKPTKTVKKFTEKEMEIASYILNLCEKQGLAPTDSEKALYSIIRLLQREKSLYNWGVQTDPDEGILQVVMEMWNGVISAPTNSCSKLIKHLVLTAYKRMVGV